MRRWLVISLVLTAAALATGLVAWGGAFGPLPDPFPTHWDVNGKPDAWVPAERALPFLLLPSGVMALMILLGLVLPWLSPKQFEVEPFRSTYDYILLLMVALFGYIHLALLLHYFAGGVDATRLLVGGLMLFFAFLGNVTGKVRRNFWVGVRVPWTLASETVWNRTHRVAAWLWTPGGLVLGVAVLLGMPLAWAFVPFMVLLLYPVLYSLLLYKRLQREGKLESGEPVA
jgi:uncharacterized membrane protein